MVRVSSGARLAAVLLLAAAGGHAAATELPSDCFNDADAGAAQSSPAQPESLRITGADLAWLRAELDRTPHPRDDFEVPPPGGAAMAQ